MPLLLLLPVLLPAAQAAAGAAATPFERVLLVSVDGLRSDAIVPAAPEDLPGFARLRRGPHTLNARADELVTLTTPNHTGMLTSRPLAGAAGHLYFRNDPPFPGETLHGLRGGRYLPSIFDVAHDHGVHTALLAGKEKFILFDRSYDANHGASDRTGPDDGRDKIDVYLASFHPSELRAAALAALRDPAGRSLVCLHFAGPDEAGHLAGWDLTPGSRYLQAVDRVDREIRLLLEDIENDPRLAGRTAVVLTADHGGGAPGKNHYVPGRAVNHTIPFLVWLGGGAPRDLYALNAGRRTDPGAARGNGPGQRPIRNRDAGNLCLALLGLPPVPGSPVAEEPVLRVTPGPRGVRPVEASAPVQAR